MNEQPEALRLADELENGECFDVGSTSVAYGWLRNDPTLESAFELRRLHADNERLRRDAKRYRWLRDMIYDDRIIVAADRMLNGEALDVAVDAALQEQTR